MSPILPPQAQNVKTRPGAPRDAEAVKDVQLFQPSTIRSVTIPNRIVVAPMCMYSCEDGFLNDFHLAHYFSFAFKGAGLVIIEATAVEPQGRISPEDSGLWSDDHIAPLKRVADMIKAQGSVPGIQIAHAGRKASMGSPFVGYRIIPEEEKGWSKDVRGPSELPFDEKHCQPHALTKEAIQDLVQKFANTAVRADKAGIEVLEIHSAHGYLLHNFLSGNSNKRTDEYGGSLENRMRFPLEVVKAVRAAWPEHKPLWLRFSSTDFKEIDHMAEDKDGWDIYQAIEYAKKLKEIGVDVIDCSAGANISGVRYPTGPHFQVPFAEAVRREADIHTGAVGLITEPVAAEKVLQEGKADYILLAREFLRDSGWALRAARELNVPVEWPNQYKRADNERWVGKNGK
ncbi:hypothetical protein BDB00DRAFT_881699 [Zychaea mexicana]|uniref:uncharacterized protein n=1 Tax=Zychaea mexicana TaxID=64656 RepID=UPI0022FE17E0|nr:uncharacterized protein BDB00DRAFT_881699 [Zychaea mexicana]KAI9497517.1 hypothetical protein BDB00DRAFT_881699 [Zychaea mexicana]